MNCMKVLGNNKQLAVFSQQFIIILMTIMMLFTTSVNVNAQIAGKSIPELRREMSLNSFKLTFQPIIPSTVYLRFTIYDLPISRYTVYRHTTKPQTEIPNLHRYEHLPIFCKFEVKMEQAVKFPIKMRLGDVEYVDQLEGKRQ